MLNLNKLFNFLYFIRQNGKVNFYDLIDILANKLYIISILAVNIFNWLFAWRIDSLADNGLIALHYNVDFGINLLGQAGKIYTLPVAGLSIFIINFILLLCINRHKERAIIAHLLFLAALIANLVLMAALASIYLVNFH